MHFSLDNVTMFCYIRIEKVNNKPQMKENQISKKELLDLTGISYGQLYRWKRKKLIPEEWFIKKSSFTGQETFFPKEKILGRIDRIVNMKDDLSLDDIADKVSAIPASISLTKDELLGHNLVSPATLNYYIEQRGAPEAFSFEQILFMKILDKKFDSGELSVNEGTLLLDVLEDNSHKFEGGGFEIIFMRKQGISSCLALQMPNRIFFDKGTKVLFRINIESCIEELKLK